MELFFFIAFLGTVAGFLSGLLGIGGGIVMAPLLLYLPQHFGFVPLSMQTVAGLTIVQGLAACISGGLSHGKTRYFSRELVSWLGATFFIASLLGGMSSSLVTNELLMFIFACMAFIAAGVMVLPVSGEEDCPDIGRFTFSRSRAVVVSLLIGFLGGMIGQGGSFILIPLMVSYLKVPVRIAIGSNLAIIFLATLAAFIGKALTFQINWHLSVPIVLTVVPMALLGAHVSRKVPVKKLQILMAICIALAAIRISFSAAGF